MHKKRLAWMLLPAVIVAVAVATLVLSSYQKEAGLVQTGKGGRATAAAVAEAEGAASGDGATGYDVFSKSLLVAIAEANNMAMTNPAETRLSTVLLHTLDCLRATREAWQAELEGDWDPAVDGSAEYWLALHPGLPPAPRMSGLSAADVRNWSATGASRWLQKALALAE